MDGVEKRKIRLPGGNQSPGLPARSLVPVQSFSGSDKTENTTKITVTGVK